jgi:hypothetical protein
VSPDAGNAGATTAGSPCGTERALEPFDDVLSRIDNEEFLCFRFIDILDILKTEIIRWESVVLELS